MLPGGDGGLGQLRVAQAEGEAGAVGHVARGHGGDVGAGAAELVGRDGAGQARSDLLVKILKNRLYRTTLGTIWTICHGIPIALLIPKLFLFLFLTILNYVVNSAFKG